MPVEMLPLPKLNRNALMGVVESKDPKPIDSNPCTLFPYAPWNVNREYETVFGTKNLIEFEHPPNATVFWTVSQS